MKLIKKLLLPFFPQAEWLQRKWWHRLILLVSIVISFCCFYSIVLFTVLLAAANLFPPANSVLNSILFMPTYLAIIMIAPVANFLDPIGSGNSSTTGIILSLILFLILSFLPSAIYRIILFISFGKEWVNKK